MNFQQLIDKIRCKVEEWRNKINSILKHVPAAVMWVIDKVTEGWSQFNDKMDEFWKFFADYLNMAGDPIGLRLAGDAWNERMGLSCCRWRSTTTVWAG